MLSKSQKKELDRRFKDYQKGKGQTFTWDEVVTITDQALESRRKTLQISDEDIKPGRLTSQQKVDKDDRQWLKNYKFD
jgi:hypothetical protein